MGHVRGIGAEPAQACGVRCREGAPSPHTGTAGAAEGPECRVLGSPHPCLFSQMWGEAWWVTRGRARSPGGRSGPGHGPLLQRCPLCPPQAPGCSPQVARVQLAASVFPGQAGLLTRPPCFQTSAPDHSTSHHQTWGSADFGIWGLIPARPGLCSAASSTGAPW